ncbi:lipid A biosynthesis lauroyl acyltransferase [Jannaschia pagri]|uniref:Lipid A biosynthesis lauroyl acyltransferase n=1 Tax=Jannaschia pagri TaxID=2829797 RepID=A0ABQ4NIU7_9RHOB|nr:MULTISPECIES: lysophospholipid acyltransferase family protein [unclassified Jannaschia]GIT89562.1 lipid A biosynthesis lauroyl acyltransferase [Jannaschia sp. AI_61]GIT94330.1 lipid A biosynthesis lauroyl acyltransferase [Jannaschia sp. AI_62]
MRPVFYWIQAVALRALLMGVALFPLSVRRRVVGTVTEWIVRISPLRRRAESNLSLIWPDMAPADRARLTGQVARNAGRTLTGIWFNRDLAREAQALTPEGSGLAALTAAKAAGRGAIIVSGHFGQWEMIRHVLKREGLETGALYRPNNNPYYEPIFRAGIELGGQPIIPKGAPGMRAMLKHLKSGGFVALLPDQYVGDGPFIDFLGAPAATSLSPAELALRYDVPLVPAFAPWEDGAPRIVIEAPIPPSDPLTMMTAFNARLASWVERHPSQWHWLHKRWKYYPENAAARDAALHR